MGRRCIGLDVHREFAQWRTRSLTLDQSSSATTLGSFAPCGLRIVRRMQSSHPGAARQLGA